MTDVVPAESSRAPGTAVIGPMTLELFVNSASLESSMATYTATDVWILT